MNPSHLHLNSLERFTIPHRIPIDLQSYTWLLLVTIEVHSIKMGSVAVDGVPPPTPIFLGTVFSFCRVVLISVIVVCTEGEAVVYAEGIACCP